METTSTHVPESNPYQYGSGGKSEGTGYYSVSQIDVGNYFSDWLILNSLDAQKHSRLCELAPDNAPSPVPRYLIVSFQVTDRLDPRPYRDHIRELA